MQKSMMGLFAANVKAFERPAGTNALLKIFC